eukprot:458292-Amphidinium_carterae.1
MITQATNNGENGGSAEARALQQAERRVTARATRMRPRALTPLGHAIQPAPQRHNTTYSLSVSQGIINITIPWSSIVAIACAVIMWSCYSVIGSTPFLLHRAASSAWIANMASGSSGDAQTVDASTALQVFTALRLKDAPTEHRQLFNTASVASELPKGSAANVLKIALGPQVDSYNLDVSELEESSKEYLWYSMFTEEQFTTYSQQEGHMPLFRYDQADGAQGFWRIHSTVVRHAVAMYQHCKWNLNVAGHGDPDGAYLLIWGQSPKELIRTSALGSVKARTYFRRAEDLSFELIPDESQMQEDQIRSMAFHSVLGRTQLVIKLENTMAIGAHTKSSLFFDHSIVLWCERVSSQSMWTTRG